MKLNFLTGRVSRNRLLAAVGAVGIILLLLLNLLITRVGLNEMLIIDTSYEGLYTLTDMMKEECSFIDRLEGGPVKVTFCADPDTLIASDITRVVYFMALQMAKEYDNFEVETVNVTYNPTAVSKYKSTSLTEIKYNDLIISYGDRYRIASADAFWIASGGKIAAYYGEYKMATLVMSVTAVNRPAAYFITDHGETYYDVEDPNREGNIDAAYLYDLLTERGLTVKTLNLSETERIPDDCVLLIINNPRIDFPTDKDSWGDYGYISDSEKLDRYLIENHGSIMIAKDYSLSLPVFEEFLYEWGFNVSSALVRDESSSLDDENNSYTGIIAEYDTDEDSYGYSIYGEFASLSSAPSMLFDNTGYISSSYGDSQGTNEPGSYSVARNYAPFFFTSENAVAYEKNAAGEYVSPTVAGRLDVAAVTTRMELNSDTGEYKYSYVFCANSPDFFSADHLGNASFANYEVMSALTENVIRSDEYADIELGSTSMNSSNRGGKILLDPTIYADSTVDNGNVIFHGLTGKTVVWFTVVIMAVPLAVAAVGIMVRVKRKFL